MKTEKVEKLITNFLDETEYAILTRNLKQALNHGLLLKKFHRVIKSNQKAIFGKNKENETKHRYIELVTTENIRNYLVSEPNCHTKKFSMENLLAIEMRKIQILMNKPIYLGLLMLDLIKTMNFDMIM